MLLRVTCAVLFVAFAPAPARGQSGDVTIRGVVVDGATGAPISGATVEVRNTRERTATDADGRFMVRAQAGELLAITQLGYTTWAMQMDSSAFVSVPLDVDPIVMQAVEVVTDRLARRWRASPTAMRRYSAAQLMLAPVANARDFALLRASFGPCSDGRGDCIFRRGRMHQPSICIDGIPYGSDVHSLSGLPLHDLHVVEIAGTFIRVYTKRFAERLALGEVGVMPLIMVSGLAC